MEEKLRVAIIGLGQIAKVGHIPGFRKAGAEIAAACDVSRESAKQVCETFGIPRAHTDWKEMLEAGGFDAVSICTPSAYHCAMAVESARRGYHVLVEKPMATSLAECDRMIDAARESRVLLMISHNQRFIPAHLVAREIISSGTLGAPLLIQTVFGHGGPEKWSPTGQWYFDAKLAKLGVMADLGYHKLDLAQWLLGQDITGVFRVHADIPEGHRARGHSGGHIDVQRRRHRHHRRELGIRRRLGKQRDGSGARTAW